MAAALSQPAGLMAAAGPLFTRVQAWLSSPAHTIKEPKHLDNALAAAEAAVAHRRALPAGAQWRIGPSRMLRRLFSTVARHPLLAPVWADSPYYDRIVQVALGCMTPGAAFKVICRVLCWVDRGDVARAQLFRLIDPAHAWPRVPANTVYVARHVRGGMCSAAIIAAMDTMRQAGADDIATSWARLLRSELMRLTNQLSRQAIEACQRGGADVFRCDGACVCRGHGARETADTVASAHFVEFVTEIAEKLSLGAPALLITVPGTLDRLGLSEAWRGLSPAEMDLLLGGTLRRMATRRNRPDAPEPMAVFFFLIVLFFWAERVGAHGPSQHPDLILFRDALRNMCHVDVAPGAAGALAALPGATTTTPGAASKVAARQVVPAAVAGPIGYPQLAALAAAVAVNPWLAGIPVDFAEADTGFLRAMVRPRRPLPGGALLTAGVFAGYVVAERDDLAAARTAAFALARAGGRLPALPRELSDLVLAILVAPWSGRGVDWVRERPWRVADTLAGCALPPHD